MVYSNEIATCLFWMEETISNTVYPSPTDIHEDISHLRKLMGKYFSFLSHDELDGLQNIIKLSSYYTRANTDDLLDDSARFKCYEKQQELLLESIKLMFYKLSHAVKEKSEYSDFYYQFPDGYFPDDVTQIINLTYEEIIKDYINSCFISAISLCGKLLETCVSSLYIRVFGKSPDDEKLGFDAILNRLKKSGYQFHDGTKSQMQVISAHRNKAIHGTIMVPTRDEARGVIFLTKDVMIKATSK